MGPITTVTQLPEGICGQLTHSEELGTYLLEWSVQLRPEEGNWLLSRFMPDRAESPEWEGRREDGEGEVLY